MGRKAAWNGGREGWIGGSKEGKEKQLRRRMKTIKWRNERNRTHAHTHALTRTHTLMHTLSHWQRNTQKSNYGSRMCQQMHTCEHTCKQAHAELTYKNKNQEKTWGVDATLVRRWKDDKKGWGKGQIKIQTKRKTEKMKRNLLKKSYQYATQ